MIVVVPLGAAAAPASPALTPAQLLTAAQNAENNTASQAWALVWLLGGAGVVAGAWYFWLRKR